MTAGRVALIVVGALLVLVGLGVLAGGGAALWASSLADDDGFITSDEVRLDTATRALTASDISSEAPGWLVDDDAFSVRLAAESVGPSRSIFVGIARAEDVDAYLEGVGRAEVEDVDYPSLDVRYEVTPGPRRPEAPGDQTFWETSSSGLGRQVVEWPLRAGTWSVVVMNADASRGVVVEADAGAKVGLLLPFGIGLLVGGVLLLGGGGAMIFLGARSRPKDVSAPAPAAVGATGPRAGAGIGPGTSPYPTGPEPPPDPTSLTGDLDPELSRWQWLVKWFLAIPHYVVLVFLAIAFVVMTVVAFFAILFTGRYPRDIFEFNVGVLRWGWRVAFYALGPLGTDRYPPFSLADRPDYPARLEVEYPERLSRGLVLVKWWLLAIPQYVIVAFFTGGWSTGVDGASLPGLITVLSVFAVIALLFTGTYPHSLFRLNMGFNRWTYRVVTYAALMRDRYPPFRLDP